MPLITSPFGEEEEEKLAASLPPAAASRLGHEVDDDRKEPLFDGVGAFGFHRQFICVR